MIEQQSIKEQAALVDLIEYAGRKDLLPYLNIKAINHHYDVTRKLIPSYGALDPRKMWKNGLLSLQRRATKIIADELTIAAARYSVR